MNTETTMHFFLNTYKTKICNKKHHTETHHLILGKNEITDRGELKLHNRYLIYS